MKLRSIALGSVASLALLTTGVLAADLPVRSAAVAPMYAAPIFTWTGFYVGLHAGYASVNTTATHTDIGDGCYYDCGDNYTPHAQGFLGGAQIGYNQQFGALVVGLEADISGVSAKKRVTPFAEYPAGYATTSLKALGTVRGRVGFAWDRALLYVTGGLAYAKVDSKYVDDYYGDFLAQSSSWKTGWTLGAGLEYAISNNWSVKAEGLYYDLGNKTATAAYEFSDSYGMRFKTDGFIARVGVNYRFGAAAAPVMARY